MGLKTGSTVCKAREMREISNFRAGTGVTKPLLNMGNTREMNEETDKDILFSKSIKAGKRIYYIDVKKNRKDEMYLSLTESKKVVSNDGDENHVNFEKHKLFLYREDFQQFSNALSEAIQFVRSQQGEAQPRQQAPYYHDHDDIRTEPDAAADESSQVNDIKLDIEF